MNTIINGIILSVYPDDFKLNLLDRVLASYLFKFYYLFNLLIFWWYKRVSKDKPKEEATELLKYATELALVYEKKLI